jgi:hypothetical protein
MFLLTSFLAPFFRMYLTGMIYPSQELNDPGPYPRRALTQYAFPRNRVIIKGQVFPVTDILDSCASYTVEADYILVGICIPSSVRLLNRLCFQQYRGLKEVVFERDCRLQKIEYGVFNSCSSMEFITIPATVHSFGSRCFLECTKLRTIVLMPGSHLTLILVNAFEGCSSLKEIIVPASMDITLLQNYSGKNLDRLIRTAKD